MQEVSGSRSYLVDGSARARFADSLFLPFAHFSSSQFVRPNSWTVPGRPGIPRIDIHEASSTTRRACGCHKVAGREMTFDSSCLCHRGFQNELMDG